MPQEPLKPTTGAPPCAYDLDNFRTSLTGLVIYHHKAVSYGGVGNWPYKSQFHRPNTSIPLMAFNAINQTYFMASFFFLSGYFSSKALRRKGPKEFLSTKYLKLGVPTLAYTLLAAPIGTVFLRLGNGDKISSLEREVFLDHWKLLRGVKGPTWYLALVLVLDTIYAYAPDLKAYARKFTILRAINLDIMACFLIRLLYPLGTVFKPLNLQTSYAPQYVAAYALGASLSSPTPSITPTTRKVLAATSILSAATGLSLLYIFLSEYPFSSVNGGANLLAFCYATWNESTGYLLGTTILELFKSKRTLNRKWGDLAKYSYSAFLVHPVFCVAIQVWADGWRVAGVLKTAGVGTAATTGSWAVGWGVVNGVPGAKALLL